MVQQVKLAIKTATPIQK